MTETLTTPPSSAETADKTLPKHEAKFDARKMTLIVGLEGQQIGSGLSETLKSNGFKPKDELHMTVLGFKNGRKVAEALKALPETDRQTAIDSISSTAQSTGWNIMPNGQYFGLEKQVEGEEGPRRSLVEMVDCPQLGEFYGALATAIPGLELDVPPAHVTLGTQGNPQGIGINTIAELREFGQPIVLGQGL